MFGLFKRGDIAYTKGITKKPENNGLEVEIIGGYRFRSYLVPGATKKSRRFCYQVRVVERPFDDTIWHVAHPYLTRKQEPVKAQDRNAVVAWSDCAWQPKSKSIPQE